MALQHPTSRRSRGASSPRKTRFSPITKSRLIEKRSSSKLAPSKHLDSFVRPKSFLILNSPPPPLDDISVNTSFPSSTLSPNFLQSFVSEYGSSVFLAHASCPSNAAATAFLSPNRLLQPPSHHHNTPSRLLAACRLHRYPSTCMSAQNLASKLSRRTVLALASLGAPARSSSTLKSTSCTLALVRASWPQIRSFARA